MSIYVDELAVTLFDPLIKAAYQEKGFKLRGKTRTKTNVVGKTVQFGNSGEGVAYEKPPQELVKPLNIRYAPVDTIMKNFVAPEYSDIFDQKEVNFDELKELSQTLGYSIGRRSDQILIDALENSGTTNVIPAGGTNLTYDKINAADEIFSYFGISNTGNLTYLIDAAGQRALMNDNKFIDNDFTAARRLDRGMRLDGMNMFNINWVTMGRMPEGGLPVDGDIHTAYAFDYDALGFALGIDMKSEITYIAERTSWLVNVLYKACAVAIDNIGIVKIQYQVPSTGGVLQYINGGKGMPSKKNPTAKKAA